MSILVSESCDVAIPMLEIGNSEDMRELVAILINNGYEVQVTPVYETQGELEASGRTVYRHTTPRIKYSVVKILGFIEKPVYKA